MDSTRTTEARATTRARREARRRKYALRALNVRSLSREVNR